MVCTEDELGLVLSTMQQIEDQFNKHYHYPWVLLNDIEFSEKFRQYVSSTYRSRALPYILPSSQPNKDFNPRPHTLWDHTAQILEAARLDKFRSC
jgi:hypothetical protein